MDLINKSQQIPNNTQGRIEKAFRDIDEAFNKLAEKNKDELDAALIKPIHDRYPFAQNGICAMIASMGSGKSYNYLKAIAKQEVLDPKQPFYELVVICSTSAKFGKTVETYKQLIKKSKLVCVKDSEHTHTNRLLFGLCAARGLQSVFFRSGTAMVFWSTLLRTTSSFLQCVVDHHRQQKERSSTDGPSLGFSSS